MLGFEALGRLAIGQLVAAGTATDRPPIVFGSTYEVPIQTFKKLA